jgi:hypothetical protein
MDMSHDEFEALLDRCGASREDWPEDERAAAQRLVSVDERAQRMLTAARELESQLAAFQPELPDLSPRIMAAIPVSRTERLLTWLFPGGGRSFVRPALAGALPLVVGLALGLSLPPSGGDPALWELEERLLMAPLVQDDWDE